MYDCCYLCLKCNVIIINKIVKNKTEYACSFTIVYTLYRRISVKNLQYLFSLFNLPFIDFIVVMCMLANGMDPDEMLYNADF